MPNYFSHDSNARNDEKLLRLRMRHKAAGYGVYFMLIELLREKEDFMRLKDYNTIAFELREDAALVKSVIEDFGLFAFTQDGKRFYSVSLLKRMEKMEQISKARQKAANKRWNKNNGHKPKTTKNNDETIKPKRSDRRRPSDAPITVTTAKTGQF